MNGTYGTTKPAIINPSEADMFYFYRPSRSTDTSEFTTFKKLPDGCLTQSLYSENENGSNAIYLPGMYNLRLPMDKFDKAGIYTIYIKPKEFETTIIGVGSLVSFPDVTGVVFDGTEVNGLDGNGELVGYRVDFVGTDGVLTGDYKLISSSNKCEVEDGARYALNANGNLIFCTLSPSTKLPFTLDNGNEAVKGQKVKISNTRFNPVMVEVEMVEHDFETITTMLEGDQLRNLDAGTITTFNKNGEIYHQAKYGNVTNPDEDKHYDFKIADETSVQFGEEDVLADIKDNI